MGSLKVRFSQSSERVGGLNYALRVEVVSSDGMPKKIFVFHQMPAGIEGNTFAEFDHVATPVDFQEIPEDAASEIVPWYRTDKCTVWFRSLSDLRMAKQMFVDDIFELQRNFNVLTSEEDFRDQTTLEFSDGGVQKVEDVHEVSDVQVDEPTSLMSMAKMAAVSSMLLLGSYSSFGASIQSADLNTLDLDTNPSVVTNVSFEGLATSEDIQNAISTNNQDFVDAVKNTSITFPSDIDVGDLAGYGTVGALIVAMAAAIAWLKNKALSTDSALALKADSADLPYAIVEPGKWEFSGQDREDGVTYSVIESYYNGIWYYELNRDGDPIDPGHGYSERQLSVVFDSYYEHDLVATRASLPGHLFDRAVNVMSPEVTATTEWIWADGETGTPVFSNGYWTVQDASFDTYDGPVAGSATDTEITFAKTETKSFYYATTDYDYETYETVFVFNVGGAGGEEVRAKCKWSDSYGDNIVESIEYDGVEYVLEYPATEYSQGTTYYGTGTVAEHIVSLVTTYGPTVTLTMPQAVSGRVRDLIARIDLSQAAGAPPVAFSGGSFDAVDGEMPELVKGVNLLSFTETAAGVFAVAYKEVKLIAQGGS